MTTVHQSFDIRIFHKECKTLANAGYDVTLIAQHNKKEIVDGIKIIPFNDIFLLIPIWFLIIFLDAMVSGSIVDSRSIWFFGAVILIISRNIKRKESTIKNYKLL